MWVGGPPWAIAEGLPVLSGTALPCPAPGAISCHPSPTSRGGRRFEAPSDGHRWSHLPQALICSAARALGDPSRATGAAGGTTW